MSRMTTKAVAIVGTSALATVHREELARVLDAAQELLVTNGEADPGPYEIRAYDLAPEISLPRRRKRKGRGRHKADRWR